MENRLRIEIDVELLSRLKRGEEAAFDVVYRKYSSWVYNFIHSLLFDKLLAEDLTQTVFLKIWEKRGTIDPEVGLEAYLFAISRNLVYKETENRLRVIYQAESLERLIEETDSLTERNIEAESLRSYIRELVELLPAARKQIFRLSRYEHLTNKEIACRLSISEKTVENQLTRALHFIKQKLSEDSLFLLWFLLMIK